MTKKDEYRQKRKSAEKRKNIIWIAIIALAAVAVVGIIVYSQFNSRVDVIAITPQNYSQVNGSSMGDPNAPVKVDIYSDFQCPYCKKLSVELLPTMIEKYVDTGKVYLTYHTYNIIGPESDNAAMGVYCAADQNRYWDYHDILFANWTGENVGDYTSKKIKAYAESIGLDTKTFNDCYDSGKVKSQIDADKAAGDAVPLTYTPSVLINGKLDEGNDYLGSIEAALAGN